MSYFKVTGLARDCDPTAVERAFERFRSLIVSIELDYADDDKNTSVARVVLGERIKLDEVAREVRKIDGNTVSISDRHVGPDQQRRISAWQEQRRKRRHGEGRRSNSQSSNEDTVARSRAKFEDYHITKAPTVEYDPPPISTVAGAMTPIAIAAAAAHISNLLKDQQQQQPLSSSPGGLRPPPYAPSLLVPPSGASGAAVASAPGGGVPATGATGAAAAAGPGAGAVTSTAPELFVCVPWSNCPPDLARSPAAILAHLHRSSATLTVHPDDVMKVAGGAPRALQPAAVPVTPFAAPQPAPAAHQSLAAAPAAFASGAAVASQPLLKPPPHQTSSQAAPPPPTSITAAEAAQIYSQDWVQRQVEQMQQWTAKNAPQKPVPALRR